MSICEKCGLPILVHGMITPDPICRCDNPYGFPSVGVSLGPVVKFANPNTDMRGWVCPKCERPNSPYVNVCPCWSM